MKSLVRCFCFLVLCTTRISSVAYASPSGNLYGIDLQGSQEEVFSIDPSTGTFTPLVATGAPTTVNSISAFDPVTKRLFFISYPSADLYVVNVATAAVNHVSLGGRFPILQFDPTSNTLYGIDLQAGQVEVFSIDPSTGTFTPLVATGAPDTANSISAFDPVTKRLFFMSFPSADLYVVNVATAAVSHVSLGSRFPILQFDPTSNTLYGIDLQGSQEEVFSIDPSTGTFTPLVATGAPDTVNSISAFDPVTKRLFFMSFPGAELYVVNVATAAVSHVSLSGRFPILQFDPVAEPIPVLSVAVQVLLACAVALVGLRRLL